MASTVRRKLTTILAADAAGYSRAMDKDELKAFDALRTAREVFTRLIERHDGRIVNTAGDGLIAEFPSVVEAVQCAMEVQNELSDGVKPDSGALYFRIGIHLGDVMIDGSDLLGEGVNLAARLESMCEPGGVLISQQVYDQVQHKLSVGFEYIGDKRPKNFSEDVPVYRLSLGKPRYRASAHIRHSKREPRATDTQIETPPPETLKARTTRLAKIAGIIALVLVTIDLTTGSPFWAHWPVLALATLLALQAAPLFVQGGFQIKYIRTAIIVFMLALINLFTWTGYPWVFWPAGAIIVFELIRRSSVRSG